jgi:uncharacterized protein YjiS (DUF1127 family)
MKNHRFLKVLDGQRMHGAGGEGGHNSASSRMTTMTLLNHTTGYTPASGTVRTAIKHFLARAGRLINLFVAALIEQRARQASLVLLRSFDDRQLRDIGLDRCTLECGLAEAAKLRIQQQDAVRRSRKTGGAA